MSEAFVKTKRKPLTVRGREFASMTEAAKHFGITVTAIHHAMKRGRIDQIGVGKGRAAQECRIGGKTYRSRAEAANDLGVKPSDIYGFLKVSAKIKVQS
jgi:hypothetical protein